MSDSSAEELARRYRHLFTLPSLPVLSLYVILSGALLVIAADDAQAQPILILYTIAASFISAFLLRLAAKSVDSSSIASLRRVLAVVLAANTIWILSSAFGLGYSLAIGNPGTFVAGVSYGAFLASGFELIIMNGAFIRETAVSIASATIHPIIVMTGFFFLSGFNYTPQPKVLGLGTLTILISLCLVIGLNRIKTERGDRSITIFQAFLKTWVAEHPEDLENTLDSYTQEANITTRVMKFAGPTGAFYLVLPGIHPGPFYPVGSYNLPGLLFRRFKQNNAVALTLHRPGGHERNLATQSATGRYVDLVATFAASVEANHTPSEMRGPVIHKIKNTTACSVGFGDYLLLILTSSPRGTDDIDLNVEEKLSSLAKEAGFDVSVVDAHNSINNQREQIRVTDEVAWRNIFSQIRVEREEEFRTGFAHSSEIEFDHQEDVSDAGIGVLLFAVKSSKWVLVMADSNNAATGVRESLSNELTQAGFKLMDLCTSDTHNLAARGLTIDRGYYALGERTQISTIADTAVKLAKIAETRLSQNKYGVSDLTSTMPVLGAEAISEFASITLRSSAFAKRYLKFALPTLALLTALAIL
ncbi:MAG: DUF2070 family protein [Thaumarchaeota archaeon]|nr:DUF2070 family protein [Nitrososphaerota archaeon]